MASKVGVHTFQGGMVKDLDKSLITSERYLDAHNFRLITSSGESTGALENIEGNNNIFPTISPGAITLGNTYVVVKGTATYNGTDYTVGQSFTVIAASLLFSGAGSLVVNANEVMPANMYVVGSAYLRDNIVLFVTNNIGVPAGGRSMILKITVNNSTETLGTYEVLYDDSLNNSTGYLNFSTLYPIRALGYYETSTVQKIYWCDGYNNIRYMNIASYLTTDGLVKGGGNFYFAPDLFEFIPKVNLTKPTLDYISPGAIKAGVVQYAFQYFNNHGAETVISPLSNTIHITTTNDYSVSSVNYKGEEDPDKTTGKSVRMNFTVTDSDRYSHIRIIRLHYSTINSVPTITVVAEVPISSGVATVSYLDNGNTSLGVLTLDEFNIGETELFSAKDIAIKNERLFAANINKNEFSIGDWDSRAVRFNKDTSLPVTEEHYGSDFFDTGDYVTYASWVDDATVRFTVTNFTNLLVSDCGLPAGSTVNAVNSVSFNVVALNPVMQGTYTDTTPSSGIPFVVYDPDYTITLVSYIGDTLIFDIGSTGGDIFTNFASFDSVYLAQAIDDYLVFDIDYTEMISAYTIHALVGDSISADVDISVPLVDTPAGWDAANWTSYVDDYDGINYFNDPANDGDAAYAYIYQSDGTTVGAEGPNIKIGLTTDNIIIDSGTTANTFSVGTETTSDNKSYTSFASPYKAGTRSWQRDEVYRLYIVFFDERGRSSSAKWICDFRMPSLHENGYHTLGAFSGSDMITTALYPTVYLKSFPTGAVSAQLLRVERSGSDRSILTQALLIPTADNAGVIEPKATGTAISNATGMIKLVSPEINVTNNITFGSSDYLEYLTYFGVGTSTYHFRFHANTRVPYVDNCKSTIDDVMHVTPRASTDTFTFHTSTCRNYNSTTSAYGSSGLLVSHTNATWSAAGAELYKIANYKRDVHASQYGGQTYESRENNIAIPASDLITAISTSYTAYNGDTFINYFDVCTELYDLTKADAASANITVYVPLESSINCELRHDRSSRVAASDTNADLIQEVAGKWTNASGRVYNQSTSLYQYNTVYSQDSTAKYYVNIPASVSTDTEFDCMVRSSKVKINGESLDSWTLFPVNDFIEVKTNLGEITTLISLNDRLLFWQENAVGILSVNDRALIQDASGASLVLGTGGVLDRYDYISDTVGSSNNQHVVTTQTGVYWIDTRDRSIYRFSQDLINVSKSKLIQSWLEEQLSPTYVSYNVIRLVYDQRYNQVLFSFYNTSTAVGTTLVFDESIDVFSGFYDYYTYRFIPFNDGFMSVYHMYNTDFLFYHNSLLKERCCFYSYIPAAAGAETAGSSKYVESTLKMIFNDEYGITKVFDNLSFVSIVTVNNIELYNNTFSSIRCYNNYQNTDDCPLTYGTNLERDEREWHTFIPRNAVSKSYTTNPDIFDTVSNIDKNRLFKERMRDKYMVTDLTYTNTSNRRFVVPYIAIKYRISYR